MARPQILQWSTKGKRVDGEKDGTGIEILLADDHPLVRAGFALALEPFGIRVVAEANTPDEAVTRYGQCRPDVAILDIVFGEVRNGIDAAKDILATDAQAKIVFLSQFDQDKMIRDTYQIGAYAFVPKDCSAVELAQAVQHALRGERYFRPVIAQRLAGMMFEGERSPHTLLRPRELEIFLMIAKGWTLVQMANKLGLSVKTVSHESQIIKGKLGVHRTAELTLLAVKYDLINP